MRSYDIILKKRNGQPLNKNEIEFLLRGFIKGQIPDYQVSAFLMAVYFKGMTREELAEFTLSMAGSGDMMDLSSIPGIKVDKHSTGGVGDKTTLVLVPLVAAAGVPVAKMSGKGLGHTGGTVDKLSSIKGFQTELTTQAFIEKVKNINTAVVGQTANLVPADKRLYALRDVTATVDSISLIASSIMSKKIASGAQGLVLDVKMGRGAFMKRKEEAVSLAKRMVETGNRLGLKTRALITSMDQPLGKTVGNALEVKEAIKTLMANGPQDLTELCLTLGSHMLVLGKKANSEDEGRAKLEEILYSRKGLDKFKALIESQGGQSEVIGDMDKLPCAPLIEEYHCPAVGFLKEIDAFKIGMAAMTLGAGREKKDDFIDLSVGIELNKKAGDKVEKGEPLFIIHSNSRERTAKAIEVLKDSFILVKEKPQPPPLIYEKIKK